MGKEAATSLSSFKAYDIRGKVPEELNEDLAYRIGRAYSEFLEPDRIVVGHDVRNSSISLSNYLVKGLIDSGVDILNLGLCGTEEVYFATSSLKMDGGIMITASHNPINDNGFKLVRERARPISNDSGLETIQQSVEANDFRSNTHKGKCNEKIGKDDYISHLLSYIGTDTLVPLKIVANAGNGSAGLIIDKLESRLPFEFIKMNWEPDGRFPNGDPDPLLEKNQKATSEVVVREQADLGIAWDGDFDRCFFFDENGRFIEGYYLVGLMAEIILEKYPASKIIHDPRLTWNTIEIVKTKGGKPVLNKAGHAFIKDRMRKDNAVYGGEVSGHHYFKDFAYCDSGMIPWLLISKRLSNRQETLSKLINCRREAYPCSRELNFKVKNAANKIQEIKDIYSCMNPELDLTDGISIEFKDWRFNLRSSNTESLLRLNIETHGDSGLLRRKTEELRRIIL